MERRELERAEESKVHRDKDQQDVVVKIRTSTLIVFLKDLSKIDLSRKKCPYYRHPKKYVETI